MIPFLLGLAVGLLLLMPIAYFVARRTRRLQVRTLRAERLAELGTLTGGLAHEIKNPLSTIGLNVQLLREDLVELTKTTEPDSELHDQLQRLERRFGSLSREADRLRDILEDFLRFAGRIKLSRRPVVVNDLITELIDFFEPQANQQGVRIRTQFADTTPAYIDEAMIKQAMLNLFINAVQAMERARKKEGTSHGGANELIVRTESKSEEVHIHVIDTGPGIAADIIEKIFRPYFSARPGGSGLGLAVSRRIVEEHGGSLTVHTEPGRGSDFCIALPVKNELKGEGKGDEPRRTQRQRE